MKRVLLICVLLYATDSIDALKKIVCYWGTTAFYRPGNGYFEASLINPKICTHIVYSFLGATESGSLISLKGWEDDDLELEHKMLERFGALKAQQPDVKLMVSVGGWNFGSAVFSEIAANHKSTINFAQQVTKFCKNYQLDGFDLAWLYPALGDGNSFIDRANFSKLLKVLKEKLRAAGLLLSIAVGSDRFSAEISYDIPKISSFVDFINVMTYDMYDSSEEFTGIHGALYAGPDQDELNVNAAVEYWVSQGAPKRKLILGIPTYGRSFTLVNSYDTDVGSETIGPGNAGRWTREKGMLGYNEICIDKRWEHFWQYEQEVPYASIGDQWVGFDNIDSVIIKANYINDEGLGGAMFSGLETDDFHGNCGQGKYPLISTGYNIIINGKLPRKFKPHKSPKPTKSIQSTKASETDTYEIKAIKISDIDETKYGL